ncbi:MAG: LutB/LldF family L-lactate oxidation iron-sulfur protein [Candidatus Sumerlaeia bacterium]
MQAPSPPSLQSKPRPDEFARGLDPRVQEAVHANTARKVAARRETLERLFGENLTALRRHAGDIRQHVVEHLDDYLARFVHSARAAGWTLHRAADDRQACQIVIALLKEAGARRIVKGKTMVSEEIGLNAALESAGFSVLETDLGEFILQIDHDHPSHIVTPVIHKSLEDVAAIFEREKLGPASGSPEELAMRARARLRAEFERADAGISGVNFAVAESGRVCIVENEGNNRFCTSVPRLHIALMGIEKIIPRDADLALLLKLLAVSSTGQALNVYTHFLRGARRPGEPDGPDAAHLVLVDNGRSRIAAGEFAPILRCIRCGACLNVCPVYRQATGHGYGSVYPGPVGAVLSPILRISDMMPRFSELPKASSLCAACEEVCPVNIPIPELLLRLRRDLARRGLKMKGDPPFTPWRRLATRPMLWRLALGALQVLGWRPAVLLGPAALRRWAHNHNLPPPPPPGESFRSWWAARNKTNRSDRP